MNFKKVFSAVAAVLMISFSFFNVSFAMENEKKQYSILKIPGYAGIDLKKLWGQRILKDWEYLPSNDFSCHNSFKKIIRNWMRMNNENKSLYLLQDKNQKINSFLIIGIGDPDDVNQIENFSMKSTKDYQLFQIEIFASWNPNTHRFGGGCGAILLFNVLKSYKNKVFVYLDDATKKEKGRDSYYTKHGFTPIVNDVENQYNWMYKYINTPDDVKYCKPIEIIKINELK